jgi:hypothetical protein
MYILGKLIVKGGKCNLITQVARMMLDVATLALSS